MGVLEIVLLIAGAVILILGFILPVRKEEASAQTKEMAQDEIKKLVSAEMAEVKSHVEDVVDESIEYAMEKTERSLERLSNEKIMAVNEYSDTVLSEIHKNHEEVMFLYDMLNDKHANLKNTVSQVNKTVKAVEVTTKEAEAVISSMKGLQSEGLEDSEGLKKVEAPVEPTEPKKAVFERISPQKLVATPPEMAIGIASGNVETKASGTDSQAASASEAKASTTNEGRKNGKQRILELHRQGQSTVAIAKELGLGVGEVKLIIDLYKNL